MNDVTSNQPEPLFSSGQIVALDNKYGILYGEIIETVSQRQICWVRTIAIALEKSSLATVNSMESNQSLISHPLVEVTVGEKDGNVESSSISHSSDDSDLAFIDLHRNVDLLFPLNLFRVAFDTEIVPLLNIINFDSDSCFEETKSSRKYLNWFLKDIWQNNRDKFQV